MSASIIHLLLRDFLKKVGGEVMSVLDYSDALLLLLEESKDNRQKQSRKGHYYCSPTTVEPRGGEAYCCYHYVG